MNAAVVTGASGFVGRRLVAALAASGRTVLALDRCDLREKPLQVRMLVADICDRAALDRACSGAEVVFHLAALLPQRRASRAEMRRVNVEGTRTVVEAARAAGVLRLVLLSSAEVYGIPTEVPCSESARLLPIGEYGRNKVEAEAIALRAGRPEAVVLRPPTIVGPGMLEPGLTMLVRSVRSGLPLGIPGGGANLFQMVCVDDVVEACLRAAAIAEAAGEIINLGYEPVMTMREIVEELRRRTGAGSFVFSIPSAVAKPVLSSLSRLRLFPLEADHVSLAFVDYAFDTTKARTLLGWRAATPPVDALLPA